jgi:hypothetical protein
MMFIPREAVLIDREGREVCVVPFTRRLDKIALQHNPRSSPHLRSPRIFRMTNDVDRLGRPILRERGELPHAKMQMAG